MSPTLPWLREAWQILVDAINQDRVAHALLIRGPRGVGKTQLALQYAHRLLCQFPRDDRACGDCGGCQLLAAGTHPDFQLIAPEEKGKAIKVDVVRHLIQDMALTPQFGGYRVVIIDQADALNANSANALLKSLEEPPSGTVIVLVTDRPHQLPATIRSRCRNLVLGPVRRDEAIQWLSGQGLGEAAENLLSTASGAPLGAVSLQGSEVLETRHIRFDEWMGVIAGGRDPLDIAEVWSTQAGEMEMAWIASWLSDAIRLGMTEGQGSIRNQDLIDRLRKLAARTSVTFLITAYDRALAAQEALRGPANRQLVFEELLIFWAEAREPAH